MTSSITELAYSESLSKSQEIHVCWLAVRYIKAAAAAAAAQGHSSDLLSTTSSGSSSSSSRMRVFTLLLSLGFLLKEARAWGFKNGIFHNSIWLGKQLLFLSLMLTSCRCSRKRCRCAQMWALRCKVQRRLLSVSGGNLIGTQMID